MANESNGIIATPADIPSPNTPDSAPLPEAMSPELKDGIMRGQWVGAQYTGWSDSK